MIRVAIPAGLRSADHLRAALTAAALTHLRYLSYAEIARREGNDAVAAFWEKLAGHERRHAELWLFHLDRIGSSEENLIDAANAADHAAEACQEAAQTARRENCGPLSRLFELVARIELDHAVSCRRQRQQLHAAALGNGASVVWRCRRCGLSTPPRGTPPGVCPVCRGLRGVFEADGPSD